MRWSPEEWQLKVEGLVEKCTEKVLKELEEEIMERLYQMSQDIIEGLFQGHSTMEQPVAQSGIQERPEEAVVKSIRAGTCAEIPLMKHIGEATGSVAENEEVLWYGFGVVAAQQGMRVDEFREVTNIPGMEGSACLVIRYEDLGILACRVPKAGYSEESLHENLQELSWVEKQARCHEEALVGAMQIMTVIPLPFCTVFTDPEHMQAQLQENYAALLYEIQKLKGHYEMQLKLWVNQKRLQGRLSETIPYAGAPGGSNYLLRRQWEKKLVAEKEQLIEDYGEYLYQALKGIAKEAKLQDRDGAPEQDGVQEVFTACFLLAEEAQNLWEEKIQAFDQEADSWGFIVEVSGPFPPYHFSGISEGEGNCGGNSEQETGITSGSGREAFR